jgi:hypothetical protein
MLHKDSTVKETVLRRNTSHQLLSVLFPDKHRRVSLIVAVLRKKYDDHSKLCCYVSLQLFRTNLTSVWQMPTELKRVAGRVTVETGVRLLRAFNGVGGERKRRITCLFCHVHPSITVVTKVWGEPPWGGGCKRFSRGAQKVRNYFIH